jgi:tetratricopeptide (TPR) repeat protein
MARKRLNKKVALIGSAVLSFVVVLSIGAFLYLSRDPQKFIKDGDTAFEAARQTTDPEQSKTFYTEAERNYKKAYGLGKSDEFKAETLYRLGDVFVATGQWRDVLGCWSQIVRLDPKDCQVRYRRLKFFYIAAQTSPGLIWQEVASQASELINVVEKPGASPELAAADTSKWEIEALKLKGEPTHRLVPYLHLIQGRANLEIARLGMVTNKADALNQAAADLEKVKQLEPANAEVYLYLAQAVTLSADIEASKGNLDAKDTGQNKALDLLKEGIKATNDSVLANINLLDMRHLLAQSASAADQRKRILALEPEFVALSSKFGSSAEPFSALAGYYADFRLGPAYLDKSIDAIEKAIELDKNNADYSIAAANLYYRRYNINKQKENMNKAIETAKKTLLLPEVQEATGPRSAVARGYQARLNLLLASCYIDQILDPLGPLSESDGQKLLTEAQQAVHQIEQLFGSGDEPQVIKWQGMVELAAAELAKEDTGPAIRKLYKTYTQLKASARSDPQLSYRLAKLFAGGPESGAVGDFLGNAIQNGIEGLQPEARLDYAELLARVAMWKAAQVNIDVYEERCGASNRSKILRISTQIGAREFADAEPNLAQIPQQDPNWMLLKTAILEGKVRQIRMTIERRAAKTRMDMATQKAPDSGQPQEVVDTRSTEQLIAEAKSNLSSFAEYMGKLLEKDPNAVSTAEAASMCEDAIATGQLDQANIIADTLLKYQPDNPTATFYKRLLAEPAPAKVPAERIKQLREDVLTKLTDPVRRAIALGTFYQTNGEPNKAFEQFKKLAGISADTETLKTDELSRHRAEASLFDIALALEKKDWETTDKIVQIAQKENIDGCSGNFFAARVAIAKGQYDSALASINDALAQRPVFGYGYLLRARINAALGNETAALTDIQTAATTNPMDKSIARELANRLYVRNQKLGSNVSSAQSAEARNALDWAMALNPGDLDLMSFYAEYISDSEPNRALAIRQNLQENSPSMQNALLLARLASHLALNSTDTQRRQALFDMTANALEQAKRYDPQNPAVLESYAEYYRLTNQEEKAEQILTKESQLLWRHYIRGGRFDEARKVLEQSYQANPKDVNTLKGLVFLAERFGDRKAVTKYSEELLSTEDTIDNHLLMIQTYLNVGLVNDAEQKLASFREKYPSDSGGLLLSAWLNMRQGKLKEALELANKRLEGDQSDAIAWRLRGQINSMLADQDQAIMDLKRSKTLSDSAATRMLLARAYMRAGRTEDAITELKSSIEDPQAPDDARSLLEQIYSNTRRDEALKDFYAKTLEKLPESVYWYRHAAGFAGGTGDFEKAGQLYNTALRKSTEQGHPDIEALAGYLRALLASGKIDKMFEEAGKYIDGNFALVAYFRMAEGKMKLGDRVTAIQYCTTSLEKTGENTAAVMQVLERIAGLLGEQEAEKMCREKIAAQPESFTANWAMYNLCRLKGDYDKALEYIDKCIKMTNPEQPRWLDSTLQKTEVLILAYTKTSDNNYLQSALNIYESLLIKMPNNTGILNNIAYILAENNRDLDKALEYIRRAYEIKPDDPTYLDTYAFVLYKKGTYAEAVQWGQASIQQYEAQQIATPSEIYEHLGQSHEHLGEVSQASDSYKQALEAGKASMPQPVKDRITAAIDRLDKVKGGEIKGQ